MRLGLADRDVTYIWEAEPHHDHYDQHSRPPFLLSHCQATHTKQEKCCCPVQQ